MSWFAAWSNFQDATDPSCHAELKEKWVPEKVKLARVFCAEYHRKEGYREITPGIGNKFILEPLAKKSARKNNNKKRPHDSQNIRQSTHKDLAQ